jgi:2,5-diketo-D-gluconate reductase A
VAQYAALMTTATVKPVINQLETHPFFQQGAEFASLTYAGAILEAWAPFAEGRNGLFTNADLQAIGQKHGKSVAQIVLRWHNQRGAIVIPRSSNPAHRRENLAIFDFRLDADDLRQIAALDLNRSQFPEWT